MPLNGRALAATGIGTLLVWSGIRGWSMLGTIGDLISGKAPSGQLSAPLTVDVGTNATPGSIGSSNALANTALQYKGHCYLYGGAPGKDAQNCWDCSSFVNYVASVKCGLAIPGYSAGAYDGSSHGPPTGMWGLWPGLSHISRSQVQAGDIIVWAGHMGIALSNNTMISALNTRDRTTVSAIEGYGNGPILCYGRYK